MIQEDLYHYAAVVTRWIDGDTCKADVDLGFHIWSRDVSIRVLGIDCPERGQPGYGEAARAAQDLVPLGTRVLIRSEKLDSFGRLLADLTTYSGADFAMKMLADDFGEPRALEEIDGYAV